MYTNLRLFSHYSIFESDIKIKSLTKFLLQNEIPTVGICDRMNLFGAVDFSKSMCNSGIKPVIGCLINVEGFGYLPFYVKDQEGFQFLSYILSFSYIRKDKVYLSDLKDLIGNIILTGGADSVFYQETNIENLRIKLRQLKNYAEDLYIEIQNLQNANLLLRLAIEENVPIVITSPVHFLLPENLKNFLILQKIKDNGRFFEEELQNSPYQDFYFKTQKDILQIFPNLIEGIENSNNIAKKCNFSIQTSKPMIPSYDVSTSEEASLRQMIDVGLKKRLKKVDSELHKIYWDRIDFEMDVLVKKGFCGYFLITADFVQFARNNKIPVGPGRGSGAGSLVAYSLTITDIDPIKFTLIFERFLNPERNSMPDFDIDFCPERRHEVVEYLIKKYGKYNVTNIITFGKLNSKAVIRDVGRVLGLSFPESDRITKQIPSDQINPLSLSQVIEIVPQLKAYYSGEMGEKYKEVMVFALELEGLIRNTSKHAAGIVICDRPIYEVCPLYRDERGDLVTQFNLQDSETVGCVKFDFLGLRTLTIIDHTLRKVGFDYNHIHDIPLDDGPTYKNIGDGNLEGIFQFESTGIRDIIYQLKPDNIDDLIAINALYRPGPIKQIPNYIKCKNGQEKPKFLHELTRPILEKTFGIMVYQEQVMDIARICSNYSMGEADLLRRAMGKKKHEEMAKQEKKFIEGALEKGISMEIAKELFQQMSEFAGYGFNKSHASPYAWIAYLCAYLKTHYPKEFLTSCLSLEHNDDDKLIMYIYNIKRLGIPILRPCIMNSKGDFTIENHSIRYGLNAIKGLGEGCVEALLNNNKVCTNIYSFVENNINHLNKKTWRALVLSGSLDIYSYNREILIDNFDAIKRKEQIFTELSNWSPYERAKNEQEIFGFFLDIPMSLPTCTKISEIVSDCIILGEILATRRRRNKNTPYAFVRVGDGYTTIDVTVFSHVLLKADHHIKEKNLIVIKIKTEAKEGLPRYTAKEILSVDEFLERNSKSISIDLDTKEDILNVKKLIQKQPEGNTSIHLLVNNDSVVLNQKIRDSLQFRNVLQKMGLNIF